MNKIINSYIRKHVDEATKIKELPSKNLSMVVVIPAFNEPALLDSLRSIADCDPPDVDVEVIVVLNAGKNEDIGIIDLHSRLFEDGKKWAGSNSPTWLRFHFLLENNLPEKHAGVGLARKIGMDEAAQRLFFVNQAAAPIVCFDADCKCSKNYLKEIYIHFKNNQDTSACSIHFEHPVSGDKYPDEVYEAIKYYELHLRYYKQALEFAGAPFAFHTVGSSMAVRAIDYCKQGGMNKRKAGEDFYFLQKFIELGSFSEIGSATVIPSPRASERVPFGTGRAVGQHLANGKTIRNTYHFKTFLILKEFFSNLPSFYKDTRSSPPEWMLSFLGGKEVFEQQMLELKLNSKSQEAFNKRFFRWFNAFKTLKLIHFLRDNGLGEMDVLEAAVMLEKEMGMLSGSKKLDEILWRYRVRDRKINSAQIFAAKSLD